MDATAQSALCKVVDLKLILPAGKAEQGVLTDVQLGSRQEYAHSGVAQGQRADSSSAAGPTCQTLFNSGAVRFEQQAVLGQNLPS